MLITEKARVPAIVFHLQQVRLVDCRMFRGISYREDIRQYYVLGNSIGIKFFVTCFFMGEALY